MIQIVRDNETSELQRAFVKHWSQLYFGGMDSTEELEESPVDYRVFASENDTLISHVAVTALPAEVNGTPQTLGAIGGLFTVRDQMGHGFGSTLMDAAESLVFDDLRLSPAILFCLPELLAFYGRRGWRHVLVPVTLAQPSGEIVTWPEQVMAFSKTGSVWCPASIHVLYQIPRSQHGDGDSLETGSFR